MNTIHPTLNDIATDVLAHVDLLSYKRQFLTRTDGLAILALLCNAGAKGLCGREPKPHFYDYKPVLVTAAIQRTNRANWWLDQHNDMAIVFILTAFGQVSFHFRSGDEMPRMSNPPAPNGRGWDNVPRQAQAEQIARQWVINDDVPLAVNIFSMTTIIKTI